LINLFDDAREGVVPAAQSGHHYAQASNNDIWKRGSAEMEAKK
jgi:hypothetical protein